MSSPTNDEINALSLRTTNFSPDEAPSSSKSSNKTATTTNFLALNPITSASYPKQPKPSSIRSISSVDSASLSTSPPSSTTSNLTKPFESPVQTASSKVAIAPLLTPEEEEDVEFGNHHRRQSSVTGTSKIRFLKLGPVHWGSDGTGKGDWSEVDRSTE